MNNPFCKSSKLMGRATAGTVVLGVSAGIAMFLKNLVFQPIVKYNFPTLSEVNAGVVCDDWNTTD
jgi:hypothetical protein